jgi:hypothetical protein
MFAECGELLAHLKQSPKDVGFSLFVMFLNTAISDPNGKLTCYA